MAGFMGGPVGTQTKLTRMDFTGHQGALPVEGDLMRSEPGGSCYLIDEVRPSKRNPRKLTLIVTRLGKDACQPYEPGVFCFEYGGARR